MAIEEFHIGLYFAGGEGLTVAVAQVDAVQTCAHLFALGFAGAAGQGYQQRKNGE